jgi:hypothetical protein
MCADKSQDMVDRVRVGVGEQEHEHRKTCIIMPWAIYPTVNLVKLFLLLHIFNQTRSLRWLGGYTID